MDLKKLQQIIVIAKEKNISKAAQKLYISQSVLSLNLRDIERELGCTLFQRSTRGLTITYEGELLVDTAQCILSVWDRFKREIQDISSEKGGCVKLGISSSRSPYVLPSLVAKLQGGNTNIKINAVEGFSYELEEALKKGTIDLAVYPLPLQEPSLGVWKEVREEILICTTKNSSILKKVHYNMEEHRRWIALEDIKDEPIISLQSGQKLYELIRGLYSQIGVIPNVAFTTHNMYTAINFVKTGYGMTFVYFLPEQFIDLSELEFVSITEKGIYRSVGIVYNPNIYLSRASKLVADMLVDELGGKETERVC